MAAQHKAELGSKVKSAPCGILFVPSWASWRGGGFPICRHISRDEMSTPRDPKQDILSRMDDSYHLRY